MELSKIHIESIIKAKGYLWFEDKVNIVGIRTNDNTPDKFNDWITVSYKINGVWKFEVYEATTDPGLYYLNNPMRLSGTFVMAPGQYVDVYEWGTHVSYEALILTGKIRGWRDSNKNNIIDVDKTKIYTDGKYVDIHRAHEKVIQWFIGKYSAGCQVIRKYLDWLSFLGILKSSKQKKFTYTLLEEDDWK